MKDRVMYNGEKSCLCPKCNSKNVYYMIQKKVILSFSPNNNLIENKKNGEWHTLRSLREKFIAHSSAWESTETEYIVLVCRDCGESEEVLNQGF